MNPSIIKSLLAAAAVGALTLGGASNNARASYEPVSSSYTVSTSTLNINFEGGFSVNSGTAYLWSPFPGTTSPTGTAGYNTANVSTGDTVIVSSATLNGDGGDPFGLYASGTFYAGTYTGTDDPAGGLYYYNTTSGTFTPLADFEGLYSAASNPSGTVFVAGLNEAWTGTYGQNTVIAVYNSGSFKPIIQAVGNSAGVAFDNSGNLYYASYADTTGTTPCYLYKWSADDVSTATGTSGTILPLSSGTVLGVLPVDSYGANGVAVDAGGNVFVASNGSDDDSNGIFVWAATSTVGAPLTQFAYLTPTTGAPYDWAGFLVASGTVLEGSGTLYLGSSGGLRDLTAITYSGGGKALKATVAKNAVKTKTLSVKQPKATSNRDAHHQIIKAHNSKVRK
ncbi:MAG: SMP-30/gluconolactonase/LRE family protein [Verrucomicrobiales bacterium]|jgi:hypothetical protein|nr:SMP-30/gluconolactonase/LRE family protein [Verrucomicrobiales bacterium]